MRQCKLVSKKIYIDCDQVGKILCLNNYKQMKKLCCLILFLVCKLYRAYSFLCRVNTFTVSKSAECFLVMCSKGCYILGLHLVSTSNSVSELSLCY